MANTAFPPHSILVLDFASSFPHGVCDLTSPLQEGTGYQSDNTKPNWLSNIEEILNRPAFSAVCPLTVPIGDSEAKALSMQQLNRVRLTGEKGQSGLIA